MASAYAVGPIRPMQVDQAYCLIEAVGYGIGLDAWREYCAVGLRPRYRSPYVEEIVTSENAFGYVNGIAIMRARHSARLGFHLSVPVFVVASAADARGVSSAMLRYVTTAARNKHCNIIHIANPTPDQWSVGGEPLDSTSSGIFIPV
ncbi:hypothetical protein AB4Z34_25600 [Ensifer sp. 2YAB10]|uniref:hypothetical protein n=1 Tax=unclassified Ensifer TaxID=2633371 RepID=UPI000DE2454C